MRVEIENLVKPEILIEINNVAVPDVNLLDLPKAQRLLTHKVGLLITRLSLMG